MLLKLGGRKKEEEEENSGRNVFSGNVLSASSSAMEFFGILLVSRRVCYEGYNEHDDGRGGSQILDHIARQILCSRPGSSLHQIPIPQQPNRRL